MTIREELDRTIANHLVLSIDQEIRKVLDELLPGWQSMRQRLSVRQEHRAQVIHLDGKPMLRIRAPSFQLMRVGETWSHTVTQNFERIHAENI